MLTEEGLRNRAGCMNRVHDFANIVAPRLIDALRQGFQLTKGRQFYQKDKDRLQGVLAEAAKRGHLSKGHEGRQGARVLLRSDAFNVFLEITDNYPTASTGAGWSAVDYYNRTIYLWNNKDGVEVEYDKSLPMHSQAELVEAKANLEAIDKEISDLNGKRWPLMKLLGR